MTSATLTAAIEEGRLIRDEWSRTDAQGRQLLCLYTALLNDPEARPETCPANVAPKWIAELLPWCDDAGTIKAWPAMVRRWAKIADRLGELQGERSERLRSRCLAAILRDVLLIAGTSTAVVNGVLALCDRHAGGGSVTSGEWAAARAAAWEAAWAAARAAARAAEWEAAREAARAAAWAAARAATWEAAREAAEAAARAAEWEAAREAAADRITSTILDLIEQELSK